jgi:hypothetical protein
MANRHKNICYRCESVATTREHFPPKSFFPKGGNLQLNTIRSCVKHNNSKSNDDQYLLAQICINASKGDNLAKRIFNRSIVPMFERSPAFINMITQNAERLPDGSVRYLIDTDRFNNFFDSLSCAVFFDKFNRQYAPNTHTMSHVYLSLGSDDPQINEQKKLVGSMLEYFFKNHRDLIEHFEADHVDEVVYTNELIAPAGMDASITIAHSFYGVFEVVSMLTYKLQRVCE